MKNTKIEDYLGKWEDLSRYNVYHIFIDEDNKSKLTTTDTKKNINTTVDFDIIRRERNTDQVNVDNIVCDVWEITPDHIVLNNPLGFVFKLERIL